jgi:hypothetical protein
MAPALDGNDSAARADPVGQVVLDQLDLGNVVQVHVYDQRRIADRRKSGYVMAIENPHGALGQDLGERCAPSFVGNYDEFRGGHGFSVFHAVVL